MSYGKVLAFGIPFVYIISVVIAIILGGLKGDFMNLEGEALYREAIQSVTFLPTIVIVILIALMIIVQTVCVLIYTSGNVIEGTIAFDRLRPLVF